MSKKGAHSRVKYFTHEKLLSRLILIIIIIMSRRQRGYPWPSLAISPYHSSPPAGLQGYILCPHIVAVCRFVLVVPLLHIHMWGSTGVHRLWARPCFSSSVSWHLFSIDWHIPGYAPMERKNTLQWVKESIIISFYQNRSNWRPYTGVSSGPHDFSKYHVRL